MIGIEDHAFALELHLCLNRAGMCAENDHDFVDLRCAERLEGVLEEGLVAEPYQLLAFAEALSLPSGENDRGDHPARFYGRAPKVLSTHRPGSGEQSIAALTSLRGVSFRAEPENCGTG